jgi:RNA polymerase sigma-70 factor (ECF subfamily)
VITQQPPQQASPTPPPAPLPAGLVDQIDLVGVALAAGRGDAGALTELVTRTSSAVWRVCAALVDRDSADDLAQDTYLRAVRSLATYRGDSEPLPWLLTIARRVCAEEITRRQRERLTTTRLVAERLTDGQSDTGRPGALGEVSGRVELLDALSRLPVHRREALVLTGVAGLSYADAAGVCGCPVGTIRSRVARARTDLADALWPERATSAGRP